MDAGPKRFFLIEIDPKCLSCVRVKYKSEVGYIRDLQPCFDIFRNTEGIEYASAVSLNLE